MGDAPWTLDAVVTWLYSRRRRATYGAVAGLLDKTPRELMSGRPPRNYLYSWVVALRARKDVCTRPDGTPKEVERSKQGWPTGYKYHKIDPECRTQIRKGLDNVIKDSAELSHWLDSRRRISSRIKHPALKRLYEKRDHSQIRPDLIENIERFLAILDYAEKPQDFGSFDEEVRKGAATRPSAAETRRGFGNLHPLKGDRKGSWSVFVSSNWRITFRFERGEALEINLEDYH